jgi:hypothetical protein
MPLHIEIAADLGPPVCFCDSHPPWRRASNEGSNGLLGQYFPTGTDLNHHSVQHLRAVENELNNRACRVIADRSPAEPFSALLASPDHQTLRRRLEPALRNWSTYGPSSTDHRAESRDAPALTMSPQSIHRTSRKYD